MEKDKNIMRQNSLVGDNEQKKNSTMPLSGLLA